MKPKNQPLNIILFRQVLPELLFHFCGGELGLFGGLFAGFGLLGLEGLFYGGELVAEFSYCWEEFFIEGLDLRVDKQVRFRIFGWRFSGW
jgi:hypothetical protein